MIINQMGQLKKGQIINIKIKGRHEGEGLVKVITTLWGVEGKEEKYIRIQTLEDGKAFSISSEDIISIEIVNGR